MKKVVLSLLVMTSPILCVENIQAPNWAKWYRMPSNRTLALVVGVAGFFRLASKEPVSNPEYRGSLTQVLNLKTLVQNPKEYATNIKDIVDTQIIGQAAKSKSVPVGTDGDKIAIRKKDCPPTGILGYTDFYVNKVGDKAFKTFGGIMFMYHMLNKDGFYGPLNNSIHKNDKDVTLPSDANAQPQPE